MNQLEQYVKTLPTRKISKGAMIVLQEEAPDSGFALTSGIVKLCNVTAKGVEKTLSFITPGNVFPVCWLFSKTEQPLFYYQAYTDCKVALIQKRQFTEYIQEHRGLGQYLLDSFTQLCVTDALQINALIQTTASMKIAAMLRYLCLRYGHDTEPNSVRIGIPLTQQEIANLIGLTRETTILELSKLKKRDIIDVVQRHYIVNTTLLNTILDDEYSPGISLAS